MSCNKYVVQKTKEKIEDTTKEHLRAKFIAMYLH